jgi:hypothetical protein
MPCRFDDSTLETIGWSRFKPALSKPWLYLLSGLMWSAVGILLNTYAYRWLRDLTLIQASVHWLPGILLGSVIHKWGFSRFAGSNIERIESIQGDRPCIFAFQKWTSYPLIAVMISLGIFLRKVSPIPKPLLAILYTGIGLSLLLSSLLYYKKAIRVIRK